MLLLLGLIGLNLNASFKSAKVNSIMLVPATGILSSLSFASNRSHHPEEGKLFLAIAAKHYSGIIAREAK